MRHYLAGKATQAHPPARAAVLVLANTVREHRKVTHAVTNHKSSRRFFVTLLSISGDTREP
jgi:hypothetical protein